MNPNPGGKTITARAAATARQNATAAAALRVRGARATPASPSEPVFSHLEKRPSRYPGEVQGMNPLCLGETHRKVTTQIGAGHLPGEAPGPVRNPLVSRRIEPQCPKDSPAPALSGGPDRRVVPDLFTWESFCSYSGPTEAQLPPGAFAAPALLSRHRWNGDPSHALRRPAAFSFPLSFLLRLAERAGIEPFHSAVGPSRPVQ
jgi:hypothetical protein